jgi:hypothetical protein
MIQVTMSDSIRCNIVLLPSEAVQKKSIDLSTSLAQLNSMFCLGDSINIPHITLYMSEYPREALSALPSLLQGIIPLHSPIEMKTIKIQQSTNGYFDIEYERSSQLTLLHETIISALNPLRGAVIPFTKEMDSFSEDEQYNIRTWGYPHAHALYRPHVTITRFHTLQNIALLAEKISNLEEFSFFGDTIGIALTGEHGTCAEPHTIIRSV